ncbi:M protein [Helicobacter pylori]|nr:M protein [Helicobacter pylori]
MGCFFRKFSNDTQENPKDALKKEEALKKVQEVQEENAKLNRDKNDLARERDKLADQNKTLTETNQKLTTEKERLERESKNLATDKENLTTALSTAKTQAEQTSQKLKELEQRHASYQKLEKLYEVFLEVRGCLNFGFVATTHSAMDLIASVLSDSKYYLESLYNKASQELSDKRSDKGEKLAELFDLLFEYIKDSKLERLKEPSAYDYSCKTLYPEQNTSQKMQRVVLRGYKHNDKVYYTIVDMGG